MHPGILSKKTHDSRLAIADHVHQIAAANGTTFTPTAELNDMSPNMGTPDGVERLALHHLVEALAAQCVALAERVAALEKQEVT